MESQNESVEQIAARLASQDYWGAYFVNQFYFRINTRRTRIELGLKPDDHELPIAIQRQLQNENLPALFHEFLHYLHEVSTVIGNISMGLSITMKSCFTNWLDKNLDSARSNGLAGQPAKLDEYSKAWTTMSVIDGTGKKAITGKMDGILGYTYEVQSCEFNSENGYKQFDLNIPKVKFVDRVKGLEYHSVLYFGKFYLYEGLAYEMDRIVDKEYYNHKAIRDKDNMTEYAVLRQLAKYLFSTVTKKTYLSVAILSLQHLNCGETFIILTEEVKKNAKSGIAQQESVNRIKKRVSAMLLKSRNDFYAAQDEYVELYHSRPELQEAFRFVAEESKRLYDERIKNPCFEIDMITDGRFRDLLDKLKVCDYMYIFKDTDPYMRDFIGTSLDKTTSQALKALIAFDDYACEHKSNPTETVEKEPHQCPFFAVCDLELRKKHEDICSTKPWRIFEISQTSDKQFCWYGTGVGQGKSQVAMSVPLSGSTI